MAINTKSTIHQTPKPPPETLAPGSLVFTPPDRPVDLRDFHSWWTWTHGASWRHPEGPEQGHLPAKFSS